MCMRKEMGRVQELSERSSREEVVRKQSGCVGQYQESCGRHGDFGPCNVLQGP